MTKYEVEPYCTLCETVLNALDTLPKEQQYPTLREIAKNKIHPPLNDTHSNRNVNYAVARLALGYKGIEVEE